MTIKEVRTLTDGEPELPDWFRERADGLSPDDQQRAARYLLAQRNGQVPPEVARRLAVEAEQD